MSHSIVTHCAACILTNPCRPHQLHWAKQEMGTAACKLCMVFIFQEFIHSPIYPVLIISYEMYLRSHHILKGVSFDLIICDEGHRLKNAGAKTTSVSVCATI